MVRLSADLIQGAAQYTNPIKERELDLRGYKVPLIENLGATLNQFDTIDFSDNELRKLDNFPYLPRLKCLLLNNNRIIRIGDHLEESIPNLDTVIMTNNSIQELADIEKLSTLQGITTLSFLHNSVTSKPNYRLFVIHKFPNLKLLDFTKVKDKERKEAKTLFKSQAGKEQLKEIEKRGKTFVPGAPLPPSDKPTGPKVTGLNPEEVRRIKTAIAKATSLEEIERLSQMLRSGQMLTNTQHQNGNGHSTMEVDE